MSGLLSELLQVERVRRPREEVIFHSFFRMLYRFWGCGCVTNKPQKQQENKPPASLHIEEAVRIRAAGQQEAPSGL